VKFINVWIFALCFLSGACKPSKPSLWIYTSLYKEVIAAVQPPLQALLPDVEIKFFQGGSENIAAKLNMELLANRPQANLVLTSDPFWYEELKRLGKLEAYRSPVAGYVPTAFTDPDSFYSTVRVSSIVMAYHQNVLSEKELPHSWKDLTDDRWKGRLTMGSPLESGSAFTTVAMLFHHEGWDYFTRLRSLDLLSSGGNSTVLNRIETKERQIGLLLLENVLKAMKKGSPIRPIYPKEGVIPVPGLIAILKGTKNISAAQRVYDWFFSLEAQRAMVAAGMHSFYPQAPAPQGWLPLSEILAHTPEGMFWGNEVLQALYPRRDEIKRGFSDRVLR